MPSYKSQQIDENDGIHITKIVTAVPCRTHGADIGDACWNLVSRTGLIRAICDKRARSAGANGIVTPYRKPGNAPASNYKKDNK